MENINVGNLIVGIKTQLAEFQKGMKNAHQSLAGFGKMSEQTRKNLRNVSLALAGVSGSLTASLGMATKAALDYNKQLANLQTMVGNNEKRMKEWRDGIQALSADLGKSTADLTDGAYQVVSAFGDSSDAMDILAISAKAATAGAAETTDAINLLSAVTKGYGDTSKEAVESASDLAFMTVKLGQTTFPELASSIGRVVPLAASLTLSQKELFAVMATATGVTGSAAEVSTQLRGVLQSLMAPTKDMTELLNSMGYESGKAMLQELGLADTLKVIKRVQEESGKPLQAYISSIEGQTLALALSGEQADAYTEKLKQMENAAGATQDAFDAQTKGVNSAGFALEQAKKSIIILAQQIGQKFQPAIEQVSVVVASFAKGLTEFVDEHPRIVKAVGALALALGGIAAVLGTILAVSTGLPALLAGLGALSGILAVGAPLLVGLAAVAGAIMLIIKYWDNISAAVKAGWETIIKPAIGAIKDGFIILSEKIAEISKNIWDNIKTTFGGLFDVVSPVFGYMIDSFGEIWKVVQRVMGWVWTKVSTIFGKIYNTFVRIMEKFGVEMPEFEELISGLEETNESVVENIKSKWDEFTKRYKENLEEQTKKTDDEITKQVELAKQQTEDLSKEEDKRTEKIVTAAEERKEKQKTADDALKAYREKQHADMVAEMLKQEEEAAEKASEEWGEKFDLAYEELKREYGEMLNDEQIQFAAMLEANGEDWRAFIEEEIKKQTPTAFDIAFQGVGEKFEERIDAMADAWLENIQHGRFKDSFDFMGEYLKRTFQSTFMDIETNILQAFFDKLKRGFKDALAGVGQTLLDAITGGKGRAAFPEGAGAVVGAVTKAGGALATAATAALPALGIAAAGAGAYFAAKAMAEKLGYKHTTQKERSIKAASKEGHLAAKYAGLVAAYNDVATWTAANARLMNEVKVWADKTWQGKPLDTETAVSKFRESIIHQMLNDPKFKGKIPKSTAEQIANIGAEAIRLYKTGELAELDKANTLKGFHTGGIIPGRIGEEKIVKVLAGEEVVTRNDPRHIQNFGQGMKVIITGNNINSELDMQRLAHVAADEIMKQLKYQTKFVR